MTAPSPSRNTGRLVALGITAHGTKLDTDRIVEVETWHAANRIPRARIVIDDGEASTGRFPLSEAATFVPGTKIEITCGYEGEASELFSGVVTGQRIQIEPGMPARVVVDLSDPLLKMTVARRSKIKLQGSDADVVAGLVAANGGSIGKNECSSVVREAAVQADISDWDLVNLRAEASGCLVYAAGGRVDIVQPAPDKPVLSLTYGESIIAIDAAVDAVSSLSASAPVSRAWNYSQQKVSEKGASGVSLEPPGNVSPTRLSEVLGVDRATSQTAAALDDTLLETWATSRLLQARLALFSGSVRFQGSALAKPGTWVTLGGLGSRFNGDALVTGVNHLVRDGDWQTTASFGVLPSSSASRRLDLAAPAAAGLAPPLRGLQTAIVKQVATDPDGDFRVLVTLPLVDPENGLWARLAQPYASKGFGWSMLPEVGDEVLLGFMNEDSASPVIVGSVYSSTRAPKYAPTETNDIKAVTTRSLMEMKFDDKSVILTISTPGGRVITLDDDSGTISISDKAGNKLTMDSSSVDLVSAGAMKIKSTGAMSIECGANLTVSATQNCDISALELSASGKTKLALASSATASLSASAILEITGALVKIN